MPRQINIKQVFNSGFRDLVVIKAGTKAPLMTDWPNYVMTEEHLKSALAAGIDTYGLKAKHYPGVDIDTKIEGFATGARELALSMLGEAPVRYGDKPKSLLIYRTNNPFKKFTLKAKSKTSNIKWGVEILGDGQQYIIAGQHPTAGPYEYDDDHNSLDVLAPNELTEITEEQAQDFLAALADRIDPEKWDVTISHSDVISDIAEPDTPSELLLAPDIQSVRYIVENTPNHTMDRDEFRDFGMAIHGATGGSGDGWGIFQRWAERWTGGEQDADAVAKVWQTQPRHMGWYQLQALATKLGSIHSPDVLAQDDFEVSDFPNTPREVDTTYTMADVASADGVVKYVLKNKILREIRYDPREERWWCYDGKRWQEPSSSVKGRSRVNARIRSLLESMAEWLREQPVSDEKKQLKILNYLRSNPMIDNVRRHLEELNSAEFWVDRTQFNDPVTASGLLNCPTGTYYIENGEWRIKLHDPDDFITEITAVSPKFNETGHPTWTDLLHKVVRLDNGAYDQEAIDFLQRYLGSSVLGHNSGTKILLVMLSETEAGKTSITNTIAKNILGDYGTVSPDGLLLQSPKALTSAHPTGLAHIMPARFAVIHEGTANKEFNSELVKKLTGGDTIPHRKLYKDFGESKFTGRIVMSCNDFPQMDMSDSGMLSRLAIMEFTPIPKDQIVLKAKETIEGPEAPFILGWLMQGCINELTNPVGAFDNRPKSLAESTSETIRNPMDDFVDACILDDYAGTPVSATDLWKAYVKFTELYETKLIGFGRKFNRHPKIIGKKSKGRMGSVYNITLRPVSEWSSEENPWD